MLNLVSTLSYTFQGAVWSHTGFYYWNPMNDKLKKYLMRKIMEIFI